MEASRGNVSRWDVVIAAVLSVLGVLLMYINVAGPDGRGSVLAIPAFLAITVPVAWRRVRPLTVTGIVVAAHLAHLAAFGSLVRCGVVFPVLFLLAYTAASRHERLPALIVLGLTILGVVFLSATDPVLAMDVVPVFGGVTLGAWVCGRVVHSRSVLAKELEKRNEELRARRDERAAMQVAVDRTKLSSELESLLHTRLEGLSRAAEAGTTISDPDQARAALEQIEADSRSTLDEMRQIVGVLRGGSQDAAPVAPVPAITHLDALLVRSTKADARIAVEGDPRTLPATVELSAYRIVEQLVTAMTDDPDASIEVKMCFTDDGLEIRVVGPVAKAVDVRAAVARARERAVLHEGSLRTRVSRGRLDAVAQLPVLARA